MAGKTKPGIPVKGINIKLKMINDLIDVTGSAKDSWNPAEISDDMKAIAYIHDLADTWNPAQLNEALKYLGFATIDSWNPAIIEETKNKLVKYFLPTDASGNPIELNLKGSLPYEVTALTIDLLPIQDLHGYDSPWAGGAGKNKFNNTASTSTEGTTTFTINSDGTVSVSGSTTNATFKILGSITLSAGTYVLSGGYSNDVYLNIQSPIYYSYSKESSETFTVESETTFTMVARVRANVTVPSGAKFYPMIRLASVTDTSYEPYENICPITGRDSVTLTVNGDDTEITFEDTVFGGNVNVLEGGTSSTYGYIASYDGEELPGAWISDRDAYTAGTTPTDGAEVAYLLTTPETIETPANEIALVNGVNTLSTDGDNINITYKANLNS